MTSVLMFDVMVKMSQAVTSPLHVRCAASFSLVCLGIILFCSSYDCRTMCNAVFVCTFRLGI